MKTSFYFVFWILIYPILGLFHNSAINENAFLIALLIVWGISRLLNNLMPDIMKYEAALEVTPLLENVYTGNVGVFQKKLKRDMWVNTASAIYFILSTVAIVLSIFLTRTDSLFALLVFAFFSISSIVKSIKFLKAYLQLKENPSPEQCVVLVDDIYKMDYASYYEAHEGLSYQEMFPPKPRNFKVFQIFSFIFAILATIFGLTFIAWGIVLLIGNSGVSAVDAFALTNVMYGILAIYYGIRDLISSIQSNVIARKNNL